MATRAQLYHGWKVIAALFLVGMMVYGCGLYSFTLFITPLTQEFGWSRAATSGLVSVYWLAAPLALASEPVFRRLGGFRMIALGVVLASAALFAIGMCNSLPMLYALRFAMGLGKVLMACGVSLMAARWFSVRFGLALAICYAGWHFGGVALVPLTQWLIDHLGWRETAFVLGAAILFVALPPLAIWARRPAPADLGQEPETGLPLRAAQAGSGRATPITGLIRLPIVQASMAITMLGAIAYGAILSNEAALIDELPAARGLGASAVSLTAISALVGAVLFGWLADRMAMLPLILIELGLLLLGTLGFGQLAGAPGTLMLYGPALCLGLAVGGFEPTVLPHMKRNLPQGDFGNAYGVWYVGYLAVLFAAPIGMGWLHDRTGDYRLALWIMAGTTLAAFVPAVLAARIRPGMVTKPHHQP